MRFNLRWRLTFFYALVSASILTLGGVVVFAALRSSIHQNLDESLRDAAGLAISQLSGDESNPQVVTESEKLQARLPGATVLLVYDNAKHLTDRVGTPPVNAPLEAGYASINGIRIFTEHVSNGTWVQAMRSEVETLSVLKNAQRSLLIGLPMLLLVGVAAGYLIADRALKPVDEVSSLASSIATSGQYQARVPETPGNDEMARLTQTVNAMLGKLEATIDRERAFALAAAHELRTPLAVLQARASLSLERERSVEQYRQALEVVNQTSLEMNGLIESLQALARTNQMPAQQIVHLPDLVLEVTRALAPQAHDHRVQLHLETQPATTTGDITAIGLALTNLVSNAIKFAKPCGQVYVRCSSHNNLVQLEVSDDGIGIPENQLERLQQPFQRGLGLQAVTGTGLGLALVAAVSQQHAGRLELSRAVEGGLKAVIFLPTQD
jgi:signal transduction histidine kinase